MSADEPLFIVTEELLSDLYESQLSVLILIISVLCVSLDDLSGCT